MKIKVNKRIKGITIAAGGIGTDYCCGSNVYYSEIYTCQREDEWLYILWHRQEYG